MEEKKSWNNLRSRSRRQEKLARTMEEGRATDRGSTVESRAVMYRETRVYRHFIVVTRRAVNMQMKRRTDDDPPRSPVEQPRSLILFRRLLPSSTPS